MENAMKNTKYNANYRDKSVVMKATRLGAMHQNRLSFTRSIIRKMSNENWKVFCSLWDLDIKGFGTVIYTITTDFSEYNFVVFSQYIAEDERIDRVIAEKWDVTFSLIQGKVNEDLLAQMRQNVPLQEAGRNTSNSLVLARANKSVRTFEHIVEALKNGKQPDIKRLSKVGYILRTTAVYGNGKFGIADFGILKDNPDFKASFSPQMCACYLLRHFSVDWVNHIASSASNTAIALDDDIAQYMGTGNATGLGMAPYLINHPQIVDMWMTTREKAIAKISVQEITNKDFTDYEGVIKQAIQHLTEIETINDEQNSINRIATRELKIYIASGKNGAKSWKEYIAKTSQLSLEAQEIILSSIMEIYEKLIDDLAQNMNAVENLSMQDGLIISDMIEVLEEQYQWALKIDFSNPNSSYWFWYRSEVKEEPRLGVRGEECGEDKELPLDIARQVNLFYAELQKSDNDVSMAEFLLKNPKYRTISRRVWTMGNSAMGDIQMNVLDKNMLPIHLLRCKLAMFGATKFDPRSNKWVQVTLFQGAPLLKNINAKSGIFPTIPEVKKGA